MTIRELAKDIHLNAVEHGWWEGERKPEEIVALIHSEWSEALEEARAGRPLVWYHCDDCDSGTCCAAPDKASCGCGFDKAGRKPEGIAVELIDGCIRILDYLGYLDVEAKASDGSDSTIESLYSDANVAKVPNGASEIIYYLHLYTAAACGGHEIIIPRGDAMIETVAVAMSWVRKQGIDPLALLLEKHAFNKTRPYKHGKRF